MLSSMRTVLVLLGSLAFPAASLSAEPIYDVRVEEGRRTTSSGDTVRYELYVPETAPGPRPTVVLTHGFARSLRYQRNNARYLAERGGFLVLVPNLVSLLGGAPDQLRNIENTADHVRWLVARSLTTGDSIEGRVDRARLGLAGHSAGGAVSFEAALALASTDTPVEALALLDAVPWRRTTRVANELPPMDVASFTSEPSPCNAFGNVQKLEEDLRFPTEEVRIVGGTHCDPENPTDFLCKLACGGGSTEGQSRYQELTQLFFANAFGEEENDAYRSALDALENAGAVERTALGPDVAVSLRVDGRRGVALDRGDGPLRVTADVFARPTSRQATWYVGLRTHPKTYWVTPRGLRRLPAAFARFEPVPLDDLLLYEGPRPTRAEMEVILFVIEGGRLLAYDRLTVSGS